MFFARRSLIHLPVWLPVVVGLVLGLSAHAQLTELPIYTVTGRQAAPADTAPWSVRVLTSAELARQPGAPLDEILRAEPGFTLFRRSGSRTAHPTAQGVTLRGLGPSGASRALVLLDGLPVNDPFGGWVTWSALDTATLEHLEITRSGGAGPWGSGALGGTIHLFSAPTLPGGQASATWSEAGARAGALAIGHATGVWTLSARAALNRGARLPVLRADQRGPLDTAAYADTEQYQARFTRAFGDLEAGLRATSFTENRGNGTPGAFNTTTARDLSVWLKQASGAVPWELRAWRQQRDFASTFTSVNTPRTTETPALDQYAVPVLATGASTLARVATGAHTVIAGADARTVRGTTHERFRNLGSGFTRDREAGGRQTLAGVFAEDQIRAGDTVRVTLGGRLDYWQLADGQRIERDLATGTDTRNDTFADRDGTRASLRAGLNYQPTKTWTLRAAAYSGFRVPTLNELYRPFRVRNDTTEANPALQPEALRGAELGAEWRPAPGWSVALTGYDNRLRDLIANTTLAVGPATLPGFDPVPAGGVLRQRTNAGEARVRGLELTAARVAQAWTTTASATLTDARWRHAGPGLTGRQLAQTPRWTAAAGLSWQPAPTWALRAQGRAVSRQYEDDLNTLRLGAYGVADLAVSWDATAALRPWLSHGHSQVRLGVENVFDHVVETAKTADGLVSVGSPRLFTLELQFAW